MKTPHIHADVIKAWADGAKIEYRHKESEPWSRLQPHVAPIWADVIYRIKPEPKPDIVGYIRAVMPEKAIRSKEAYNCNLMSWCTFHRSGQDNIKCIFDGETHKLKAVEFIGE